MNLKKKQAARMAAEKERIRGEENSRIQFAAMNPVKTVLKSLHTTLSGLDEEAVSYSRAKYGSNKVTHEKITAKTAGWGICQPVYRHPLLFGGSLRHDGYGFPSFFTVWQFPGGF